MRQSLVIQRNWQSLIKPEKLEVEPGADPSRVATVVAEPLERGFGMTLGNAIRRILLSSLQGAAVTAVQIDGVLHEFSSIPGVREDVTDIVLNIKQLALRMHGEGPKRMTLTATGPGEVRAGQIQAGHDIDIMNPELVICTLDDGVKLGMEFTVNLGKGYVAGSANRPEDAPIGLIPVDSDLLAGAPRVLQGRADPRRPGHRLRQAAADGGDQRRGDARGFGGAGRPHPAGPAAAVHQLRRAAADSRRGAAGRPAVQPQPAAQGGRAGAVGAQRRTA